MNDTGTTLNLVRDRWLPLHRRSGAVERCLPADVVSRWTTDPPAAFAWPRSDLNGAAHELLIGMLSAAMNVADESVWHRWWRTPPEADELHEDLLAAAPAMNIDGTGKLFMQNPDPPERSERFEPETLLMNAPGANTRRQNTNVFVRRWPPGSVVSLPAAAVVALPQPERRLAARAGAARKNESTELRHDRPSEQRRHATPGRGRRARGDAAGQHDRRADHVLRLRGRQREVHRVGRGQDGPGPAHRTRRRRTGDRDRPDRGNRGRRSRAAAFGRPVDRNDQDPRAAFIDALQQWMKSNDAIYGASSVGRTSFDMTAGNGRLSEIIKLATK